MIFFKNLVLGFGALLVALMFLSAFFEPDRNLHTVWVVYLEAHKKCTVNC